MWWMYSCIHSVGTFLCVVQLLPHGTESKSQSHPSLGFEGPQFYIYAYQDVSKASSDQCENLASLLGSYHATYSCAYKVGIIYGIIKKMKGHPYPATPRLSIKTIAFSNLTKAIYPTHIYTYCKLATREELPAIVSFHPSGLSQHHYPFLLLTKQTLFLSSKAY